jgi:hypothetical protein
VITRVASQSVTRHCARPCEGTCPHGPDESLALWW